MTANRTTNTTATFKAVPSWLPAIRPTPHPQWEKAGRCAGDPNPDRWVDLPALRLQGRNNANYALRQAELAATCATCPVRIDCLVSALDGDSGGIWAGTNEYERADMRDALGLPDPTNGSPDQDAINIRFTAHRLAWQGVSNTDIARQLAVSPMTVSRLLDDDPERTRNPRRLG